MAEIQPFRAFRYDLGRVGSLADVIAPPYDVIDDRLRQELAARHPNNVVHIDLPTGGEDRYARAGRVWKDWIRSGILQQDSARSLYVYEQEFVHEGRSYTRQALLARVRLEPFGAMIRPHEETFDGPKLDRLRLMEATAANLSPVFGLYDDADGEVRDELTRAIGRQPPVTAVDHLGVTGRVWPVADQAVIARVTGLLGPRPLLIADGHHRYETALRYRDETAGCDDAGLTLMALVSSHDPGLLVLPTHRLVRRSRIDADAVAAALTPHFDVAPQPSVAAAWDEVEIGVGQGGLAFGFPDGRWLVARPRDLSVMESLAADRSPDWRGLSVSVLHRLVLGRLLRPDSGPPLACDYVHRLDEVEAGLGDGQTAFAALVPTVDVADVRRIADRGEKMPQKSTYFFPKLQTGFVFNPLWSH
jgi:uncharacterized protein (DUF1015 family)